jgi:hypothetical protein
MVMGIGLVVTLLVAISKCIDGKAMHDNTVV